MLRIRFLDMRRVLHAHAHASHLMMPTFAYGTHHSHSYWMGESSWRVTGRARTRTCISFYNAKTFASIDSLRSRSRWMGESSWNGEGHARTNIHTLCKYSHTLWCIPFLTIAIRVECEKFLESEQDADSHAHNSSNEINVRTTYFNTFPVFSPQPFALNARNYLRVLKTRTHNISHLMTFFLFIPFSPQPFALNGRNFLRVSKMHTRISATTRTLGANHCSWRRK
jgi:hypothetical protein